jgi:hypothetical protein
MTALSNIGLQPTTAEAIAAETRDASPLKEPECVPPVSLQEVVAMHKVLGVFVLAVLVGSVPSAQDHPDFSGRWVLDLPSQPSPQVPRTLSVRQSLVSTNIRGEPIPPFFRDITIDREVAGRTRSATHPIGVQGGTHPGIDSRGNRADGPLRHFVVRWDANALIFESGSFTGEGPETGVWAERREVWSLESDGRLRLVITTRSSVDAPTTVVLVYRRL